MALAGMSFRVYIKTLFIFCPVIIIIAIAVVVDLVSSATYY